MQLFNKQKQVERQNRIAGQIEMALINQERKIASYLNRKTQHWNRASKITLLFLICLLFGGASLWLLIGTCI